MSSISQLSGCCHVPGCKTSASAAVIYCADKNKDEHIWKRWKSVLGDCVAGKSIIRACQRHFPAGAPTQSHPYPDPYLFNPLSKLIKRVEDQKDTSVITIDVNNKLSGVEMGAIPDVVVPPPGSFFKVAPNAAVIDLQKIRKERKASSTAFKIEEVTVLIDESDSVQVVDYGTKITSQCEDPVNISNCNSNVNCDFISCFDENLVKDPCLINDKSSFHQFEDFPIGSALEEMRQLHIDCNIILTDVNKKHSVYAHRTVLIARSPYFYKQIYLKKKVYRRMTELFHFVLPLECDFDAIDSVVSYMYTGNIDPLLTTNILGIRKVLKLFEMQHALTLLNENSAEPEASSDGGVNESTEEGAQCFGDDLDVSNILSIQAEDEAGITTGRDRKKTKVNIEEVYSDDAGLKLKVSVQKIVDNTLILFMRKIEDLFDDSAATFQVSKSPQNIVTLWQADVLLTKLFDQNHLTKFFSDAMTKALENDVIKEQVYCPDTVNNSGDKSELYSDEAFMQMDPGTFKMDVLDTRTDDPELDESYHNPVSGDDESSMHDVQTVMFGGVQIDFLQTHPRHIPRYVHMIALYRFFIRVRKKPELKNDTIVTLTEGKDALISPLLEVLPEDSAEATADLEALVNRINSEGIFKGECFGLNRVFIKRILSYLKKRLISDLELHVSPSFHEELIMHIIIDQVDERDILTLSVSVFLAKGCSFCVKKECKQKDLGLSITPDTPMCPDRQCIKRNLICDVCNKQLANSKSLARHRYTIHNIQVGDTSGLFICSHCGEKFNKKWKLNIHEKQHEDRKLKLSCPICDKVMRGEIALKKHKLTVHEAKASFKCEYCAKSFKRKETLIVHCRIHTGEKPFHCNQCEYASETKGNLKAHMWRRHKLQLDNNSSINRIFYSEGEENVVAACMVKQSLVEADDSSKFLYSS